MYLKVVTEIFISVCSVTGIPILQNSTPRLHFTPFCS